MDYKFLACRSWGCHVQQWDSREESTLGGVARIPESGFGCLNTEIPSRQSSTEVETEQ